MSISTVVVGLIALAIGVGLGMLLTRFSTQQRGSASLAGVQVDLANARSDAARAREEAAIAKGDIAQHLATEAELRSQISDARRELAEAQAAVSGALSGKSKAEAERDAALNRSQELAADRESMANQFKVLSEETLNRQGEKAEKSATERLTATQQLVTPLAEQLKQLNDRLTEVEKERTKLAAELGQQVSAVRESGETIRKEALALSSALRTPQVRGSWGEQSLRRIVEISGLNARVDFDDQQTYTDDLGDRYRPDMRINLADGKVVFVDSKVPLAAVLEAYNTEDPGEQRSHLALFAKHVRTHIDQLSSKNYWQLDLASPEFVVMFLGSDEIYRLALEQQPDLHEYAARKNVMLSSPGTLIPLLQIVAHGWKQAGLAESAARVAKLGRELHQRIATMGEHFDKLGRSINGTVTNFNKAVGTLETRVMVSARRFTDLGVTEDGIDTIPTVDATIREAAVPEMLDYSQHQAELAALLPEESQLEDNKIGRLPLGRVQGD